MSIDKIEINPKQIDAIAYSFQLSTATKELRTIFYSDIAVSGSQYEIDRNFESFDQNIKFRNKIALIKSFRNYPKDWDSFGTEPPNETAVNNSIDALEILTHHELLPDKISPSSEEGIIFEFLINSNYYLLEFCNDGDIIFLKRENENPNVFEIDLNEIENKIFEMKYGQYNFALR